MNDEPRFVVGDVELPADHFADTAILFGVVDEQRGGYIAYFMVEDEAEAYARQMEERAVNDKPIYSRTRQEARQDAESHAAQLPLSLRKKPTPNQEATMPEPLQETWAYYQRKGLSEMRPYVFKEPLDDISVSAPDLMAIRRADSDGPGPGGYIARNPKDHTDQWYVAQTYFDDNLEPVVERDDRAELVKALRRIADMEVIFDYPKYDPSFIGADMQRGQAAHVARAALAAVGEEA